VPGLLMHERGVYTGNLVEIQVKLKSSRLVSCTPGILKTAFLAGRFVCHSRLAGGRLPG
jgi:hypothetical protein